MQYKLTEDQSTDFFNNMQAIETYAEEISNYGVKKTREWYNEYLKNIKWYQRVRSYASFLRAIGSFDGLEIYNSSTLGYSYLSHYKHSGWCNGIKLKKLSKMTGLSITELETETQAVWGSVRFMYLYSSLLYKNIEILHDLKTYSTIPYTVDSRTLTHLKSCEEIVKNNKIEV